jgi:CdiI N-terminal domain
MFSIEFADEPMEYPFDDTSVPVAPGRLLLGKSIEEFLANLSLWSKADYESHWARELKSLFEGKLKVALVVSYDDPKASSNLEIWRLYRDGEWVHFQNQLPWYSNLPHEFEISEMSNYIDDRKVMDADGKNRLSEWNVALRDIEMFLRRLNAL